MQDHYSAPQNLPAAYEALLELVRERDQLMLEYVAALQFPDEQYSEWNQNSWKKYARNQLALIQAVRPLTYTDYRHRVTFLSPTLGVVGPYRLVTGWMLDSAQELRREAETEANHKAAAIEVRKRNRAKLQANRPALVAALNSPTLFGNPITGKPPRG